MEDDKYSLYSERKKPFLQKKRHQTKRGRIQKNKKLKLQKETINPKKQSDFEEIRENARHFLHVDWDKSAYDKQLGKISKINKFLFL